MEPRPITADPAAKASMFRPAAAFDRYGATATTASYAARRRRAQRRPDSSARSGGERLGTTTRQGASPQRQAGTGRACSRTATRSAALRDGDPAVDRTAISINIRPFRPSPLVQPASLHRSRGDAGSRAAGSDCGCGGSASGSRHEQVSSSRSRASPPHPCASCPFYIVSGCCTRACCNTLTILRRCLRRVRHYRAARHPHPLSIIGSSA